MPAREEFSQFQVALESPAIGAFVITPDDDEDLPFVTRGLSFATAGPLALVMADEMSVVIPEDSLVPGVVHPLRVRRVKATGTGSSMGIVGYR